MSKTTTLHVHLTFLYTSLPFLARLEHENPISCFMKNVNEQRRIFYSVSELGYGLLEFNFRRVCPHLTK